MQQRGEVCVSLCVCIYIHIHIFMSCLTYYPDMKKNEMLSFVTI